MNEKTFDSAAWTAKLASALEALIPRATVTFRRSEAAIQNRPEGWINRTANSNDYRALVLKLTRFPDPTLDLSAPLVSLNLDPTDAIRTLSEHPAVDHCLRWSSPEPTSQIALVQPGGRSRVVVGDLVHSLVGAAITEGALATAGELHRILTLGEMRELRAYETVHLCNLRSEERVDIEDGLFIVPYRYVKENHTFESRALTRPPPVSLGIDAVRDIPDDEAVLMRELTWGPFVAPVEAMSDGFSDPDFEMQVRDPQTGDPKRIFDSFDDTEIIADLLCIVTESSHDFGHQYICLDSWIRALDCSYSFGSFGSPPDRGRRRETTLTGEDAEFFYELISLWRGLGNNNRLDLALRRLVTCYSRAGRFAFEDRVLDTAIALEIMFDLDREEIGYKLKTRAAYLLGRDSEKRMEIADDIQQFYELRSRIAHGSRRRSRRTEDGQEISRRAFALARDTFIALLRQQGEAIDWNQLVLSPEG